MTTIIVCLAGLGLIFLLTHLLRNWLAFRRDDIVSIAGQLYSFDAVFKDLAQKFGMEGKQYSLIRYSFLKSRPAIAEYRAHDDLPLDVAVAVFIEQSAISYAKGMDKSAHPLAVDDFMSIASQAKAFCRARKG